MKIRLVNEGSVAKFPSKEDFQEAHPGTVQLCRMLDEFFKRGHTEFRLAVQRKGHAIIHAQGKDSDTFDFYWEEQKSKDSILWSEEEVKSLNAWQKCGHIVHPSFTCSNPDHHDDKIENRILVATNQGWVCPGCSYTQNWAHDFMLTFGRND